MFGTTDNVTRSGRKRKKKKTTDKKDTKVLGVVLFTQRPPCRVLTDVVLVTTAVTGRGNDLRRRESTQLLTTNGAKPRRRNTCEKNVGKMSCTLNRREIKFKFTVNFTSVNYVGETMSSF